MRAPDRRAWPFLHFGLYLCHGEVARLNNYQHPSEVEDTPHTLYN